jgi:hypothetical protein
MPKDTFYFTHDFNTRSDEKIKLLLRKHNMLGYGVFWAIIEDLYNNANALRLDYEGIAFDLRVDCDLIKSVINDFGLFVIEGENFGSCSVERRLIERKEKSETASLSANTRWKKYRNSQKDADALQTDSEGNARKERKGKERKEIKEIKEIKETKKIKEIKKPKFCVSFSEDFKFGIFDNGQKQELGSEQFILASEGFIKPSTIIWGSKY